MTRNLDPESAEYALNKAWEHAILGLMEAHQKLIGPESEGVTPNDLAKIIEEHLGRSDAAHSAYCRRTGIIVERDESEEMDWDVPLSRQEAIDDLIRSAGGEPPDESGGDDDRE